MCRHWHQLEIWNLHEVAIVCREIAPRGINRHHRLLRDTLLLGTRSCQNWREPPVTASAYSHFKFNAFIPAVDWCLANEDKLHRDALSKCLKTWKDEWVKRQVRKTSLQNILSTKDPFTPNVSVNATAMTLAIWLSLKTMGPLENGVATRFGATPFLSMRAVS